MKLLPFLILPLISQTAFAAGKIDYLNVVDDTVYFSTDEVKASSPACVLADTANQWTVSLNSKTGRALYSLLVSAMSAEQSVSVESGQDCADISGIERAKGISLQPVAIPVAASGGTGVQWAGYTDAVQGNFVAAGGAGKSPVLAATELCQAKYSGSRVMLWNDYIDILDTYPHSEDIWFLDAVEGTNSVSAGDSNARNYTKEVLILKNGDTLHNDQAEANAVMSIYSGQAYQRYTACGPWNGRSWTNNTNIHFGMVMDTLGNLSTETCDTVKRLACVSK